MKRNEVKRRLKTIVNNRERSSSRWPLAAAFISGIVLTACAAQVLVFTEKSSRQETIIPAPQNAPGILEPGFYQRYSPAEYGITDLVYVSSQEGLVSG